MSADLKDGYSDVPAGKIATVVTCLEMRARPPRHSGPPVNAPQGWENRAVTHWPTPPIEAYRDLFRQVGADWLWTSRLAMPDEELAATLGDPGVEVHRLTEGGDVRGLIELDFRVAGECELKYFGLVPGAIGQGAGRFLMDFAIDRAWQASIARFWVHTCHFDHPAALAFYRRSGFTPYAMMIEILDDPRLGGLLPRSAAPHVPLIET